MKNGSLVCVVLVLALLTGCGSAADTAAFLDGQLKRNKEEIAEVSDASGDILALNLVNGHSDTVDGFLSMESAEDPLYIIVDSSGNEEANYVIKIFVNYEEISFLADDELVDRYTFSLREAEAKVIPVRFPAGILDLDHSQIVSVMMFRDPEKKTKDESFEERSFCLDFEVCGDETNRGFPPKPERNAQESAALSLQFSGLMFNEDFEFQDDTEILLPPKKMEVHPGDTIKMAYRVGSWSGVTEAAVSLFVDWHQTEIDGEKYKLVKLEEGKTGAGVFEFTAPAKPGEYEVTGVAFRSPYTLRTGKTFLINDAAYRFTLVVTE